jgi:hypothetical protein
MKIKKIETEEEKLKKEVKRLKRLCWFYIALWVGTTLILGRCIWIMNILLSSYQ